MISELVGSDAFRLTLLFVVLFATPFLLATVCTLAGFESVLLLPTISGGLIWIACAFVRGFSEMFGTTFFTHIAATYAPVGYFIGVACLLIAVSISRSGAADRIAEAMDGVANRFATPSRHWIRRHERAEEGRWRPSSNWVVV